MTCCRSERAEGLGALEGSRSEWCRDNGTHAGAPTLGVYTNVHTHTHTCTRSSHASTYTPLSTRIQVSQLHTHVPSTLPRQPLPHQWAGGCVPRPRLVTCTAAHTPPCTHVWHVMLVHTHASFPPHTRVSGLVQWTCACAHTHTHTHKNHSLRRVFSSSPPGSWHLMRLRHRAASHQATCRHPAQSLATNG